MATVLNPGKYFNPKLGFKTLKNRSILDRPVNGRMKPITVSNRFRDHFYWACNHTN